MQPFSLSHFQISKLPDMLTDRCGHSISTIGVSDSCIWLLVVGGQKSTTATVKSFTYATPMAVLFELSE